MQNTPLTFLRSHWLLAFLSFLLLAVPLLPAPLSDLHWHGLRSVFVESSAAACLAFLIGQAWTSRLRVLWVDALRILPIRFLLALFVWGGVTAIVTQAKLFAVQGLLLLGTGVVFTFVVCTQARLRPQFQLLLDALTGATLLLSFSGFAVYGLSDHHGMPLLVGFYYDHQLYGAAFTILLPLMFSILISPTTPSRRLFAQTAALCGIMALGLSETRSTWIGAGAAGFVFLLLVVWIRHSCAVPGRAAETSWLFGRRQITRAALPVLLLIGVVSAFLQMTPQVASVNRRLHTLTRLTTQPAERGTDSVAWRLHAWQGARRMIIHKPLQGWGVGTYPRFQFAFTGTGDAPTAVLQQGPTIPDETHNSYLQIAAEMGLPGLVLWLGVIASTFAVGGKALQRISFGSIRQWSLLGCLSALAGQSVDALANPGWQFGEVSLFLWITLGLTLALALGLPEETPEVVLSSKRLPQQALRLAIATAVFAGLIWIIIYTAQVLPRPTL